MEGTLSAHRMERGKNYNALHKKLCCTAGEIYTAHFTCSGKLNVQYIESQAQYRNIEKNNIEKTYIML